MADNSCRDRCGKISLVGRPAIPAHMTPIRFESLANIAYLRLYRQTPPRNFRSVMYFVTPLIGYQLKFTKMPLCSDVSGSMLFVATNTAIRPGEEERRNPAVLIKEITGFNQPSSRACKQNGSRTVLCGSDVCARKAIIYLTPRGRVGVISRVALPSRPVVRPPKTRAANAHPRIKQHHWWSCISP